MSLYCRKNYMYYYTRLNYLIYPLYFTADPGTVAKINDGNTKAQEQLRYTDIVFAVSLDQSAFARDESGIMYTTLKGRRYMAAARTGKNDYLLINEPFFNGTVLKNPDKWKGLGGEFKKLYPRIPFGSARKARI